MLDLIAVSYWNIGPFRDKKISLFFEKGKYLIKAPIGSGKSFLFFDGITYGLYKSNSRNLLNIPSKIGTIKLIFEVDGQVFLVIRTLKHGKSKDSCSSQLFQIALTSEEVTEKLCVWEILQENSDIQDLLLSKNIPLEEIPFKNEADLQAQLNTLLPPIEVFSSTTILLQDAENIFEMQPAKRLEVLKNVFGLMGIEETKEIVKDKRNEVKYQIKAYQDTSHTEGKLSSGLQEMLTLFRKLQEFSEITEYLSTSLETIEELEGFSQQLGIQNFELDEKLTEFLPSIAEFLKAKREILSAEKTELWLQNQQLTEIKTQISHFFNTIQSNENKIKQIDWLLLKTIITPQEEILVELQKATAHFYEWDLDVYFEDLEYKTSKILGHISIIHENIESIWEVFHTLTNMMTNTNIGILTVLTVVIWVMTMVSGIFGMNVQLPLSSNPYAFLILIGIMLGLAAVIIRVFKKKKWL